MDNGANLSASEIFTSRIKYKPFLLLQFLDTYNFFWKKNIFLLQVFILLLVGLCVKAQRVSTSGGGSAKYI